MLNHITYNCFEILIQCVSVSVSFSRFSTIRGYLLFVPPVLEWRGWLWLLPARPGQWRLGREQSRQSIGGGRGGEREWTASRGPWNLTTSTQANTQARVLTVLPRTVLTVHLCVDLHHLLSRCWPGSFSFLDKLAARIISSSTSVHSILFLLNISLLDIRHLGSDQFVLDVRWTFVGYQGW